MLAFKIALRYLFSRKSRQAVNIISYISMGGVALASAAIIIVLSVFNGFAEFTSRQISELSPDLTLLPARGKVITDADSLTRALSRLAYVDSASPVLEEKALAICGDRQMAVTLIGLDHEGFLPDYNPYIIDGEAFIGYYGGAEMAILSVGAANGLRPFAAEPLWIRLYEPQRVGRINPANPAAAFRADSVITAGVLRTENQEFDADRIIVPLPVARNLLDYSSEASAIEITLSPGADLSQARMQIAHAVGDDYLLLTPLELQRQVFRMINIEKWITLLMLSFILVIASFNILSTMSMLIVEKRSNMSILRSLGAPPRLARAIFCRLSFLISGIGGAIGLIFGIILSLAQQFGGFIKIHASDMSAMAIDSYPVRLNLLNIPVVIGIIFVVAILTALIVRMQLPVNSKKLQ